MSFFTILIFLLSSLTLRAERDERNEHLFHRDAAVLESVAVVLYVVVVVVGVSKEAITRGKNVRRAEVWLREEQVLRIAHFKHLLSILFISAK